MKGRNLVIRDKLSSSSDPYAVVTVDGQEQKTNVVKSNLNPEWGQTFDFRVTKVFFLESNECSLIFFEGPAILTSVV